MSRKISLFELVGGYETLNKVHKIFYDKIYAHPWLGKFFVGHDQTAIEKRQTEFMAEKMGGPKNYLGKQPRMAHRQMYITNELFDLRQKILEESLLEYELDSDLIKRWLKIDDAFRQQIIKNSIEDFYHTTWKYEKRVIIPRPQAYK